MSILESLVTFFGTFPGLDALAVINAESPGSEPGTYGIAPTGESVVKTYMDGSAIMRYSFAFCFRSFTAGNVDKIANSGFLEALGEWLRISSLSGVLPNLGEIGDCESISSANGMLFDQDTNGDRGNYRIQCQMIYERTV